MKHIKKMKIDIDKKNFEIIPSVQYDSNTRFLHINLTNGSIPFDLTGCSVKISGTKQDGTAIFNNCTIINAKKGFVEVELTEQINAIPGTVKCELKIYSESGVLTTKHFDIEVTAPLTASKEIVSSNEFKALTDALKVVQRIDNKADKEKVEEKFGEVYEQLDTMIQEVCPEMFGAAGDGRTDDTLAFEKMFSYCVNNKKNVFLNKNKQYVLSRELQYNFGTFFKINGNNSEILFNNKEPHIWWYFTLTADSIQIKNLICNGKNTDQNQFHQTDFGQLCLTRCFNLISKNVSIEDVKCINCYGDAFKFEEYNNISINNVTIDNVGGKWFENNDYDGFGDAFYFGYHSGVSFINMNNISVNGKYLNNTYSRIGIVVENLHQSVIDVETNINISNFKFLNFNRCVHCENIKGVCNINFKNGNLKGGCITINWNDNEVNKLKIIGENLLIENDNNNDFNGSRGFRNSDVFIKNSIIDCGLETLGSYNSVCEYENVIINNINKRQLNSAKLVKFNNCVLNFRDIQSDYLFSYSSKCEISNSKIKNSGNFIQATNGSSILVKNSNIYKILINFIFDDYNCNLYLNNEVAGLPENINVFVNNKLIRTSLIFGYFPTTNLSVNENCYLSFKLESTPINVKEHFFNYKPGIYFCIIKGSPTKMIATGEYADGDKFCQGFYYSEILITKDGALTQISQFKPYGSVSNSSTELNIGDGLIVVKGESSLYSNYLECLFLPKHYKDYLPCVLD